MTTADSTNAEEPGFTASERSVGGALRRLFLERPERRMVVACFASHIHRVQQIIDVALEQHRKIVLMGRSMEANVKLARKLNLLHVDAADLLDQNPNAGQMRKSIDAPTQAAADQLDTLRRKYEF